MINGTDGDQRMQRQTLRRRYRDELKILDQEILRMGAFVEEAVRKSMQALEDLDIGKAEQVISEDQKINNLELEIQDKLTLLIATEQPVAGDLRHIITSLKVVAQLERMGDHAVHIAKSVDNLIKDHSITETEYLSKMADYGIYMLHEVLSAFAENDQNKAIAIAKMDDKIDTLHNLVWQGLLARMMKNPGVVQQATTLLFVSRWIERFGDHATNISEWVVYNCTGRHVELNL
jgi:phosphate transport system protein